jgi:hypothetical protein
LLLLAAVLEAQDFRLMAAERVAAERAVIKPQQCLDWFREVFIQ